MSTPWISVIVPARNAAATIAACLASIRDASADAGPIELVVADNGSTDPTAAMAAAAGAIVMLLPGIPVSAVRNHAARQARAPIIAFIDADHVLGRDWFVMVRQLLNEPEVAAVGAEYRAPDGGTWVQRTYDRLRRHRAGAGDATWLPSGNLVIRADVFEQIGGFDETLETCEDVDLCRRLALFSHRLVADDALASTHLGDPRTLRAVFVGEMWRGRDNLRVTLRPPIDVRSVLSALQPLVTVTVFAAAAFLVLVDVRHVPDYAIGATVFAVVASLPRTMQMVSRGRTRSPVALFQCLLVALAFDLGRAAAIVVRATHATRATIAEAREP